MTNPTLCFLSTVYRLASPCAWMELSWFMSTVLMTCYAGSELGTVRLLDFVDQLLDRSGVSPSVLCRSCLRLPTNFPSTALDDLSYHVRCERQWCLFFWLCTFVALWIVLWATHGLALRASVYRWCPCRDPPMCLDAQGGIKVKRQPFVAVGAWSCLPNKVNVVPLHCFRTRFEFRV